MPEYVAKIRFKAIDDAQARDTAEYILALLDEHYIEIESLIARKHGTGKVIKDSENNKVILRAEASGARPWITAWKPRTAA